MVPFFAERNQDDLWEENSEEKETEEKENV
jgi:hypothetical protein